MMAETMTNQAQPEGEPEGGAKILKIFLDFSTYIEKSSYFCSEASTASVATLTKFAYACYF